ncbi:hypothetical protein [Propionivibrio sp.]|uniref:hypothetical protein n=1 Tax=Propionivibrio sp. TaxID=2212460 RepID=UPI00260E7000|nr:hypothetical protein [Propionivibrio sp.]
MTWFALPETQSDSTAAFLDSGSAARWLAEQPQANVSAMLAGLVTQIQAFNVYNVAPRERLKTLEVLRKALFAVSGESQRRYEHKALPLLPAEYATFDSVRQLWRATTVAYLHCLHACLDRDPSITAHSAKVTHRVLSCLRMEQLNCYVAGTELDGDFWHILHSVFAAAEKLGVTRQPIEDHLLKETFESTVSGQYCMVLMLHLARPAGLSRGQFAAVTRWLARWREQAKILNAPEANPKSCCLALDLSSDQPILDPLRVASVGRWLWLDGVLRKMRERLELLTRGASPESLKLGSVLSSEECVALLNALSAHLMHPQRATTQMPGQPLSIVIAIGLENSYRMLGGSRLKDEVAAPTSSFASQLVVEQIAVFGHVVHETDASSESAAEIWRVVAQDAGELQLIRPTENVDTRLTLESLLAIRLPAHADYLLATVSSLYMRRDGHLCITASLLFGKPAPLLAEVREKPAGKLSRHPALLLTVENDASPPQLFIPAGVPGRSLSIRFYDARGQLLSALSLLECLAYGDDSEHWTIAVNR